MIAAAVASLALRIGPFAVSQATPQIVSQSDGLAVAYSGTIALPPQLAGSGACSTGAIAFKDVQFGPGGGVVGDDGTLGDPKVLDVQPVAATIGGLCAQVSRVAISTATDTLSLDGSLDVPDWLGNGSLDAHLDLTYDAAGHLQLKDGSADATAASFYFGGAKDLVFSFPSLHAITMAGTIALPPVFGGAQLQVPAVTFSRSGIAMSGGAGSVPAIAETSAVHTAFLGLPATLTNLALRYAPQANGPPQLQVATDGTLQLPIVKTNAQSALAFAGATFSLTKNGVRLVTAPQWTLPSTPVALHAFGMKLAFASSACDKPASLLQRANGSLDGLALCTQLIFPARFGLGLTSAPCVVLHDLDLYRDGRIAVDGLEGDARCSNHFALTRFFNVTLDDVRFERAAPGKPYRLRADVAVDEASPLPLLRGEHLAGAAFSIDSSPADTVLHGHVKLDRGVRIGRLGWNVDALTLRDDRKAFVLSAAGGITLPLLHHATLYVRNVGFRVPAGRHARPLIPHLVARRTVVSFVVNALTAHWSAVLIHMLLL